MNALVYVDLVVLNKFSNHFLIILKIVTAMLKDQLVPFVTKILELVTVNLISLLELFVTKVLMDIMVFQLLRNVTAMRKAQKVENVDN